MFRGTFFLVARNWNKTSHLETDEEQPLNL